ncbi:MAG: PadR family transcriptional regulator, partial [Natronomonas sp.]
MSENEFESVLASIEDWTAKAGKSTRDSDAPTALTVSCLMSNCTHSGPLWPIEASWRVFSVQTLGNQTQERYDGETGLDSDLVQLTTQHDIETVLVVGHTGCVVLNDAYERWIAPGVESHAGIEAKFSPLVSVVEDAFEADLFEKSMPLQKIRHRLVEYNVVRQTAFLERELPASVKTVGYVYDQDGAYSSFPDTQYLVALDGETDPTEMRDHLADDTRVRIAS